MVCVPRYDPRACGIPSDWIQNVYSWGAPTKKLCRHLRVEGARVDIHLFLEFLRMRRDKNDLPLVNKLKSPEWHGDGWFRLEFLRSDETDAWSDSGSSDPLPSLRVADSGADSIVQRAWHGCKLEGLYSILFHECLCDSVAGTDRTIRGCSGVYLHSDESYSKAEAYSNFVPLFEDGIFWSVVIETSVNRLLKKTAGRRTDQWIQPSHSVAITAIWICGRTYDDMYNNSRTRLRWYPLQEANPNSDYWVSKVDPRAVWKETILDEDSSSSDNPISSNLEGLHRPVQNEWRPHYSYLGIREAWPPLQRRDTKRIRRALSINERKRLKQKK